MTGGKKWQSRNLSLVLDLKSAKLSTNICYRNGNGELPKTNFIYL